MTDDDYLPPKNTTTAVLHFLSTAGCITSPDRVFTVSGIRVGRHLGRWITQLIAEHGDDSLDATVQVWHHYPDGRFEPTEITHCTPRGSTS